MIPRPQNAVCPNGTPGRMRLARAMSTAKRASPLPMLRPAGTRFARPTECTSTTALRIKRRISTVEECGIEETVHTFETKYESLPTVEYYMYVPKTVDMSSKTQKNPAGAALPRKRNAPAGHRAEHRVARARREGEFCCAVRERHV